MRITNINEDPTRIYAVLDAIKKVWEKHSDLKLSYLLHEICPEYLVSIDDDDLVDRCEKYPQKNELYSIHRCFKYKEKDTENPGRELDEKIAKIIGKDFVNFYPSVSIIDALEVKEWIVKTLGWYYEFSVWVSTGCPSDSSYRMCTVSVTNRGYRPHFYGEVYFSDTLDVKNATDAECLGICRLALKIDQAMRDDPKTALEWLSEEFINSEKYQELAKTACSAG